MNLRAAFGLARSIAVYGMPWRQPSLRRHYRPLINPGDLVFDVGAHIGDRTLTFAALGANVLAFEPQPLPLAYLRWRTRGNPAITVLGIAVGEQVGTAELAVSERNPTVSTLSRSWRESIGNKNQGFSKVAWNQSVQVPVTTLSALIETYGEPQFCKLDVEGHEAAVLAGLDRPLPALSFEYVAGTLEVAQACIARLGALGNYTFNVSLGESRRLALSEWVGDQAMQAWLVANESQSSSGDIYAKRIS